MGRKVEPNRKRLRVQVTVDPAVWERCKTLSEVVGPMLSWSQVAEYAFVTVLDQMEALRQEVISRMKPDATDLEIRDALQAFMARQVHAMMTDAYAQMEAELVPPPEMPKRGRRAG